MLSSNIELVGNGAYDNVPFGNEFICCKIIGSYGSDYGQFYCPLDIKVDEKEKLIFVADSKNHRIQAFDFNGVYKYQIVTPLLEPKCIAIDYFREGKEMLVICDDNKVYRFEKQENGQQLNEIIGTGKGSGSDQFNFDSGGMIVNDKTGNIYISDDLNYRIKIYSNSGQLLNIIIHGVHAPKKLDFNSKGQLVVANYLSNNIAVFNLEGNLISTIKNNYINRPLALIVDKTNDNVIVGNFDDNAILVFDKNGQLIKTFGKKGVEIGEFDYVYSFALDCNGRLYVVDKTNHRFHIFK